MGCFKNLIGIARAKYAVSKIPLYQYALEIIHEQIHNSKHEIVNKLSDNLKEKIINEITTTVHTVWISPDKVLANREFLASAILEMAKFHVFLISPDHDYCKFPGISGELKNHIKEIAKHDKEIKEIVWQLGKEISDDSLHVAIWLKYWKAEVFMLLLEKVRYHLKDFNADKEKDWFFPFLHGMYAFQEYSYRKTSGLPKLIDDFEVLGFTTMLDIVTSGSKNPLFEWEEHYEKKFPVIDMY
tara:strand:- start:2893 stop:3618 length:726 start_codon:yes stop_codon:yes gene_type:complete